MSLLHPAARLIDAATGQIWAGDDISGLVDAAAGTYAAQPAGVIFALTPTEVGAIARYLGAIEARRPVTLLDPDMPRPAVKSPAAARPAAAANPPAVTKPSPANSSPAKSDHTKSDHSKPDHTKPDHTKPEQAHAPAARTSRSRQRRKIVVTSCMLVGVVAFGGLAVSALVRGLPQDDAAPATAPVLSAEASAADRGTGAQMSVFLHEGEDGVAVRATLNKLRKGTGYRLYAQSFDGRRWPVVNWTGTAGVQEVEGAVPATLAEISHFIVLRSDRKTAVTVYLPRSAAPAPDAGSNGGGGAAGNGEAPGN